MRRARFVLLALASAALVLHGCGGSPTSSNPRPTPTPAARAAVTVSASPSPVTAQASTNPAFQFQADWTVVIAETAGVSGNVNYLNVTLRDDTTGLVTPPLNIGSSEIVTRAGTNHVAGRGSLQIPVGFRYSTPTGARPVTATMEVTFGDDRGNTITATGTVQIQ